MDMVSDRQRAADKGNRRRAHWFRWSVAVLGATVAALLIAVSLPPVQRALWILAARRIEAATGLRVEVRDIGVRWWPARLHAGDLSVAAPGRPPLATADTLVASWSWVRLVTRHRLETITVDGLHVEMSAVGEAPPPASDPPAGDPPAPDPPPSAPAWPALEIGSLSVHGGAAAVGLGIAGLDADGVRLTGSLLGGRASATLDATTVSLNRDGRRLPLGRLTATAGATPEGVVLHGADLAGAAVEAHLSGSARPVLSTRELTLRLRATIPAAETLGWWEPALQSRFDAGGTVSFDGTVTWRRGQGLGVEGSGRGEGLHVAGYPVTGFRITTPEGRFLVEAHDPSWGSVTLGPVAPSAIPFDASLEGLSLEPLRSLMSPDTRALMPARAALTGHASGTAPLPLAMDGLTASAALTLSWPAGSVSLAGRVVGRSVQDLSLRASLPGAVATASGRATVGSSVDLEADVQATEPEKLAAVLAAWLPSLAPAAPGGGPLHAVATLSGDWSAPTLSARVRWQRPEIAGRCLDTLDGEVRGTAAEATWNVTAAVGGAEVTAAGTASLARRSATAAWSLSGLPAATAVVLALPASSLSPAGTIDGRGTARLEPGQWAVEDAAVRWSGAALGRWQADTVSLAGSAGSGGFRVDSLRVALPEGRVFARGSLEGLTPAAPLDLEIHWRDVGLRTFTETVPVALDGCLDGDVELQGTLGTPTGHALLRWEPRASGSALEPLSLRGTLARGSLDVTSEQLLSAAGSLTMHAILPLGDLPRPSWLYPHAPSGPATVTAHAEALELTPLVSLLGPRAAALPIRSGLDLSLRWDPLTPRTAVGRLELPGLTVGEGAGAVRAVRTPAVVLTGGRLEVESLDLEGRTSVIAGGGIVDVARSAIDVSLNATLAPDLMQIVVPAVSFRGAVQARLEITGPFDAPTGTVSVSQTGGSMVVLDPPVQVTGLTVKTSFSGGVLDIDGGSADVNGGRVDLGGGWDPRVQQGIVAELEGVHFVLPEGIMVTLSGLMALEPRSEGRFALVGDLNLERGVWDRNFDLTGAILGRGVSSAPVAVDDPLDRVDVDLQVTTAAGIQVDNNLGSLQLRWQRLYVRGTLARPALAGEIRIMPNGQLTLGGSVKQISKGIIDFPGEYGADPHVEIVTETPQGQGPTAATQQLGLTDLAQAGLLRSVGNVIGLTNSNLTPIDIATETGVDPGTNLTIARVISENTALFFSTDLTNTQQQTTLLQLWNWRALPGFAVQAFTSSTEGDGAAVLERFRFGGTTRSREQRPKLDTLRFEGSWPLKVRRLREAAGFTRGQVFDPFMVFVGEARLERALASAGYPEARVKGKVSGAQSKILSFTAETGPFVRITFSGATLPLDAKERVRALYQPPPLEQQAISDMKGALGRELASLGYPEATVTAHAEPGGVAFTIEKGAHLLLDRLRLSGVPEETRRALEPLMNAPPILAALLAGEQAATDRLKTLLTTEGFPDAKVTGAVLERGDDDTGTVRVSVDAGRRILVGRILLEGDDPLGVAGSEAFPLKPGVPLRTRTIAAAVGAIRDRYENDGYPAVSVRTQVERRPGDAWDVRISLDPGEHVTVSDVVISGAPDIRRSVLRKGITVHEGDPVRLSALDATASNIASFDPVASVIVTRKDHGTTSTIDVALTEKPRWTVGTGLRYRSGTGSEVLLDLRDSNLFGRGIGVNLTGHYGTDNRAGRLYLYLPPPPGGRLSFDGWLSESYLRQNGLIERTNTITLEGRLPREAGVELRGYLTRERTRTTGQTAASTFPEQIVTLASVGGQLIVDRRDDFFNPTRGWYGALDVSYSPLFLGSTDRIIRALGSFSVATTPGSRWIWAQGLRLGSAKSLDGPLPETQTARFFAGGETTVRGFAQDTVGPLGLVDGTLRPLGGGALLVLNEEMRYRLTPNILLAAFVDAGQVQENWSGFNFELSAGSGLGVRVLTPIGPLRLDLAWPVLRPNGNSGARIYVGFGEAF